MSWIIFKDKHSDEYDVSIIKQGPITKPPLRHDLFKIDNHEGAIIQPKGYDTYSKKIEIFLDNPKRIDEVCEWLSGRGNLICSQEPDKYYEAFITSQIDYTRIGLYRQASVDFTVQPYKYLYGEEIVQGNQVVNYGNVESLPCITLYGSGQTELFINDKKVCKAYVNETMTIDTKRNIAYKNDTMCNRLVSGDMPVLKPGINTIVCTGNITKIETLARSRFI